MNRPFDSAPLDAPAYLADLEICRQAEKAQTQFYRALAVQAEDAGDEDLSQRLHGLHADEQHHLSRLTARLLEFGATPARDARPAPQTVSIADWEPIAREREKAEIHRYESLLETKLDPKTAALIQEILVVEQHHAEELGGKWTRA